MSEASTETAPAEPDPASSQPRETAPLTQHPGRRAVPTVGGHEPAARRARPPAAARARTLRAGRLRRHRRPGAQEVAAGRVRPREPRPAAGRLRAAGVRPSRLGGRRLRGARQEGGQGACAYRLEGRRLGAAVGRHHVRARVVRRRRVLRHAAQHPRRPVQLARDQGQRRVLPVDPAVHVPDRAGTDAAHGDGRQRGCRRLAARRRREAVRARPAELAGAQQARRRRVHSRRTCSASTTTSARRPSRT